MKKKKTGIAKVAIICTLVVAVFAVLTVMVVSLKGKMPAADNGEIFISISKEGTTLNGEAIEPINYFSEHGKTYIELAAIAARADYGFVRENDGKTIKLESTNATAYLEIGSTTVVIERRDTGAKETIEILKAPFEKEGEDNKVRVYFYSRDLSSFMRGTNVSYNHETKAVEIHIVKDK